MRPLVFAKWPAAHYLRRAVAASLLLQWLMLPALFDWGGRSLPHLPVWGGTADAFPAWLNAALYGAGLLLLAQMIWRPGRAWALWAFLALALLLAAEDQSRWQVWQYQSALLLLLSHIAAPGPMLAAWRIALMATYIWSGLSKINAYYLDGVFPWMAQPDGWPALSLPRLQALAWVSLGGEVLLGFLLAFGKSLRWAAILGTLMHLFILAALGPWGHDWNAVVWPWNAMMIALLWGQVAYAGRSLWRPWAWPAGRERLPWVALAAFVLLPLGNYIGRMDEPLALRMYAGMNAEFVLHYRGERPACLPAEVEPLLFGSVGIERLVMDDWAMAKLKVPLYASGRTHRALAAWYCACTAGRRDYARSSVLYATPFPGPEGDPVHYFDCE